MSKDKTITDELGDLLVGKDTDGGACAESTNYYRTKRAAAKEETDTPLQTEIPDGELDYFRTVDLSSFTVDDPVQDDPETQEPLKNHVEAGKGRGKGQRKAPVDAMPEDAVFMTPDAKDKYLEMREGLLAAGKSITRHLNNFMVHYANGFHGPAELERRTGMCRRSVYTCYDALGLKPDNKSLKDARFDAICELLPTWEKTAGEFIDELVARGYERLTKPGLLSLVQKYQRTHPDFMPAPTWYAKPGAKSREERAAELDAKLGIQQLTFDFDAE